ncbi:MAG: alpha/beta hydrolase [Balneolaceae bacterium]
MKKLLLLHGALGDKTQFEALVPKLNNHFDVYRLDFEGHGEATSTNSPFRIEYFIENVLGFLEEHNINKINIFGYSMGGYVALGLAKQEPKVIQKVATLGTILEWNNDTAKRECRYLHPAKIKEKVPHFAEQLNQLHIYGWERVVERTRDMLQYLGNHPTVKREDWPKFKLPIRFHIGDQDTTASLNNTIEIYKKINEGELCVLPATSHPFEEVNTGILAASLLDFF